MARRIFASLALLLLPAVANATSFAVHFDAAARKEPASGRLIVYLLRPDAHAGRDHQPADGFVEEDPQPMFGVDVKDLKAGETATVDDAATSFPSKLGELSPGKYRAQAVLDMHHENSDWQREPGNLYSKTVTVEISADAAAKPLEMSLGEVVEPEKFEETAGAKYVEVHSDLLSKFRGHDVTLHAGVALPMPYDPNRSYAAVYEVPGFGGDHTDAIQIARRRERGGRLSDPNVAALSANTFWILLDPESGNGHTLFADSDNNGPCGRALIEELIPAIEKKFKLIAEPSARIITGHSSGGWSSLWLATEYPGTFAGGWTSSPDPIDFRRFELVDLYSAENWYTDSNGKEIPSARFGGRETMTVRQENGMEHVLGTRFDSGEQWASWQGVWGHRDADGHIHPLYDPVTGKVDHAEAESYRRYDIADRMRKDPKKFVPIFRNNVHIVVGDNDTYYLNEAVKLLRDDLDKLDPLTDGKSPGDGYIKVVPKLDHSTIYMSSERRNWSKEMLAFLKRGGHVVESTTAPAK